MFNPFYLNAFAMTVVPCSAIGASAYIGYSYYNADTSTGSTSESKRLEQDELSSELAAKQVELESLKTQLQNQEDLLEIQKSEINLSTEESIYYEIALVTRKKEDIEGKKDFFTRDDKAKKDHLASIAAVTSKKAEALTTKNAKEATVNSKNDDIKKANDKYLAQVDVEAAAKLKATTAQTTLATDTEAHTKQLKVQEDAQTKVTENGTSISTQETNIDKEKIEQTKLGTAHTNAIQKESEGKDTCNAAIKDLVQTDETCDGQTTALDNKDAEVAAAKLIYTDLQDKTKKAKSALDALVTTISGLTSTLEAVKALTADLKKTLTDETTTTARLEKAKKASEDAKEKDDKAHEAAKAETKTLDKAHKDQQAALPALTEAFAAATRAFDALDEELKQLNTQTSEIEKNYQSSKKALEKIINTFTQSEAAIKAADLKIQELTTEINKKQATLSSSATPPSNIADKTIEEINQLLETFISSKAKAELNIASTTEQITQLNLAITAISKELLEYAEENIESQEQVV